MKKKLCAYLISVCIAMLFLSGCGKAKEAKSADFDFKDYIQLCVAFSSIDMPVGDYVYGRGNENVTTGKAEFDPSSAIYSICINPFSDETLIDDYVTDGVLLDEVIMANSEYKKYIKNNDPYFITYECCGDIIYTMPLNGKVNKKEIKKEIEVAVEKYEPVMRAKVDEFIAYLDSYEGIEKDGEGSYYYILDSKNITESLTKIMDSVEEIGAKDPIKDSGTIYADSSKRIGYIDGGSFKIYWDEYGGDLLLSASDRELDPVDNPNLGERRFTQNKYAVRNHAYEYFLDTGWIYADNLKHTFYNIKRIDGEYAMCMWDFSGVNGNIEYSTEELYSLLYDFYEKTYASMQEHGIVFEDDVPLSGTMKMSDRNDGLDLQIDCIVSFNEYMTKEEFYQLLDEGSSFFDPNQNKENDDCW